jgi:hypothetical protein
MPLHKSTKAAALKENIEELIASGRDPDVAAAIAHETRREAFKKQGRRLPPEEAKYDRKKKKR